MSEMSETPETSEKEYKYKIILTKPDNIIASDLYNKIKYITSYDRQALIFNTEKYIYNHILLPLYEKKDIEEIIYNYGIQNALQHFILNKNITILSEILLIMTSQKYILGLPFIF